MVAQNLGGVTNPCRAQFMARRGSPQDTVGWPGTRGLKAQNRPNKTGVEGTMK